MCLSVCARCVVRVDVQVCLNNAHTDDAFSNLRCGLVFLTCLFSTPLVKKKTREMKSQIQLLSKRERERWVCACACTCVCVCSRVSRECVTADRERQEDMEASTSTDFLFYLRN